MLIVLCQSLYDVIVYLFLVGVVYLICVAKKPDLNQKQEYVKQTNEKKNKNRTDNIGREYE